MKGARIANTVIAIVFLNIIIVFGAFNGSTQLSTIKNNIGNIAHPKSFSDTKKYMTDVDNVVNNNLYNKQVFSEAYSYVQVLLGKNESDNFYIVKDKNDSSIFGNMYQDVPKEIPEYAKRLKRMKEYAEENGTEVIFVGMPPQKISGYNDYSSGIPAADQNPSLDAFLYYIQRYGIDYIDARDSLKNSDLSKKAYRYDEDHHWTIESSFQVYKSTLEHLKAKYGMNLDPTNYYTDLDNYNKVHYKDSFVGTFSRNAGIPFSGRDDFTLYWPKDDGEYYLHSNNDGLINNTVGRFDEHLINKDFLKTDSVEESYLYAAYLSGVKTQTKIYNPSKPDGANILILGDSYTAPYMSFMAPNVASVDFIWVLAQKVQSGELDITEYIKKNDYDVIMVALYPGNFEEDSFEFFKEEDKN